MEINNDNPFFESSKIFSDWIPRKTVQDFFNYGSTKMSTFASDFDIRTSKVGRRIFYKYSDVLRLIENNQGV